MALHHTAPRGVARGPQSPATESAPIGAPSNRYREAVDVIGWLLQGDPAIRRQVMRDLTDGPAAAVVATRSEVATVGWEARLLALQEEDGQWGGGFYSPKWISTTYTLLQLRHFGLDPAGEAAHVARDRLIGGGVTWRDDSGFFEYLGETCVTAMNLAIACYFEATSLKTTRVVEWLLDQQLEDGGWNCETDRGSVRSSFHTTISVLEGLLESERSGHAPELTVASADARLRAHEYLLERQMFRSLSSGEIVNQSWTRFSFPPRWWYDVLRGLDYFQDAAAPWDDRLEEALGLLEKKRTGDGRWNLQNHHSGREHFQMEQPGKPSRWNTLRALRVLRWAG